MTRDLSTSESSRLCFMLFVVAVIGEQTRRERSVCCSAEGLGHSQSTIISLLVVLPLRKNSGREQNIFCVLFWLVFTLSDERHVHGCRTWASRAPMIGVRRRVTVPFDGFARTMGQVLRARTVVLEECLEPILGPSAGIPVQFIFCARNIYRMRLAKNNVAQIFAAIGSDAPPVCTCRAHSPVSLLFLMTFSVASARCGDFW